MKNIAGTLNYDTKLETDGFDKGLKELKSSTIAIGNLMADAFKKVGSTLIDVAKNGIQYNSTIEQLTTSFEVMTGSAEEATKITEKLKKVGATTPYELSGLAQTTQTLMQYGLTADKAYEATLNFGDISQGSAEKMQSIALAYGQMSSAGKVNMQDIKQMINAGWNPLQAIVEMTGKSMKQVTQEYEDGKISVEDITKAMQYSSSENGKYYKSMEKQSKTLNGQISTLKDNFSELSGKAMQKVSDVAKNKVLPYMNNLMSTLSKKIDTVDWDKLSKTLVTIGKYVVTATKAFILLKSAMAIQTVVKSFQKAQLQVALFTMNTSKAVVTQNLFNGTLSTFEVITGVLTGKIKLATVAQGLWNTVISANPIALTIIAVAGFVTALLKLNDVLQQSNVEFSKNVSEGIQGFSDGLSNAKSHLDEFDDTLFASNEKQQELQQNMQEVQDGITKITELASKERRELTETEIQKIDEYLKKLRTLQEKELAIQEAKSKAIQVQAENIAKSQDLSYQEYVARSQEWLKTAQEQADAQLNIISKQTTNEIALLNQKYGDKATLDNEAYKKEYDAIESRRKQKIENATNELGEIYSLYAKGINDRLGLDKKVEENTRIHQENIKKLNEQYKKDIDEINNNRLLSQQQKNWELKNLEMQHTTDINKENNDIKNSYKDLIKNMSEDELKQLGVLINMASNSELYGGKLDKSTQKTVDGIIENFNSMPKKSKKAMQDTMQPMLEEMENKEPTLLAKATSIANGIISRLKKALKINSPSKETRGIFKNVMLGAEVGLDSEKNNLFNQVDSISDEVLKRMTNAVNLRQGQVSFSGTNGSVTQMLTAVGTTTVVNENKLLLDGDVVYENQQKVSAKKNLQTQFGGGYSVSS